MVYRGASARFLKDNFDVSEGEKNNCDGGGSCSYLFEPSAEAMGMMELSHFTFTQNLNFLINHNRICG